MPLPLLGSSRQVITKSKSVVVACFCFLLGIVIYEYIWVIAIVGVIALKYRQLAILCFCLALLGFFHVQGYVLRYQELSMVLPEGMWKGEIIAEPDIRRKRAMYMVQPSGTAQRIWVYAERYPAYMLGDDIQLRCDAKTPAASETFAFDTYALVKGIHGSCYVHDMRKVGEHAGWQRLLLKGKYYVANRIRTTWHEPYASFVAGVLYGYRGGLGPAEELFIITGTIHIIAISGYNITLIVQGFFSIAPFLHIRRQYAIWVSSIAVILFTIFVGASASVVRAAIMGLLGVYAFSMGRRQSAGRILLYAATAMCIYNPYILLHDAGFILSVLATMGLVYVATPLEKQLSGILPIKGLRQVIAASCAASIITAPYVLFTFERVSLLGIFANVAILWAVPFVMLCGVISLLPLGIVASLFSSLALLLMKYIFAVITYVAHAAGAQILVSITAWQMLLMYAILAYAYRLLIRRDILK
jgi:competence protein ComEC